MIKYNAIGMIIFNNPLYLVGACLSAWTHRKFIEKYSLDIKLIVMINEPISEYEEDLKKYFDIVSIIKLREMKLHPNYFVIKKYSEWMKYSITKWEIFNYEEFDKILFIDIDILPIKKEFYNVFNYDTPAIIVKGINYINSGILKKKNFLKENYIKEYSEKKINNDEYWNLSNKLEKSLDAGFVLISPNKKIFEEYIQFLQICEGKSGFISKYDSGVDETTLLFFLVFYKNLKVNLIPYNYAPIPWEKNPYDKNEVKGINFLSMVKPWVKLPLIQFPEENIWHKIAKKALEIHSDVTKIYVKCLIDELYKFYYGWKNGAFGKNPPYNTECLKSDNLKKKTLKLFDYLEVNPREKLSFEQIKYIINETVKINGGMKKNVIIKMNELEKFI
jgi:hypothetical protein